MSAHRVKYGGKSVTEFGPDPLWLERIDLARLKSEEHPAHLIQVLKHPHALSVRGELCCAIISMLLK